MSRVRHCRAQLKTKRKGALAPLNPQKTRKKRIFKINSEGIFEFFKDP